MATIFKTEIETEKIYTPSDRLNEMKSNDFEKNLLLALNDMFDRNSIEYTESESIVISLDDKRVLIDLKHHTVKCEDEHLEQIVTTVFKQLSSLS